MAGSGVGHCFSAQGQGLHDQCGCQVGQGWMVSLKQVLRQNTPTSTDSFVLDQKSEMVIDAEGVIFTGSCLALEPARAMRSRGAAGPASLMKMVNAATVALEIEASLRELSL